MLAVQRSAVSDSVPDACRAESMGQKFETYLVLIRAAVKTTTTLTSRDRQYNTQFAS